MSPDSIVIAGGRRGSIVPELTVAVGGDELLIPTALRQ
jgi:hypothetical protein